MARRGSALRPPHHLRTASLDPGEARTPALRDPLIGVLALFLRFWAVVADSAVSDPDRRTRRSGPDAARGLPAALEEVGTALADCPDVRYCAAVDGRRNLPADVCPEHEGSLYRFTLERLGGLAHILDHSTEIITHTYKRDPLPPGSPRT